MNIIAYCQTVARILGFIEADEEYADVCEFASRHAELSPHLTAALWMAMRGADADLCDAVAK